MREIKFRAWDDYRKAMSDEVDIYCETGIIWWVAQWRGEDGGKIEAFDSISKGNSLMQYTGLHDKNGKEIWEGDIFPHNGMNLVVKYELGAVVGHWFGSNEYIFFDHYANDDEVEIIGNIYENKELLND